MSESSCLYTTCCPEKSFLLQFVEKYFVQSKFLMSRMLSVKRMLQLFAVCFSPSLLIWSSLSLGCWIWIRMPQIIKALFAARFAPPRQTFRFKSVKGLQPETKLFCSNFFFSEAKEEKEVTTGVINNTVPIFFFHACSRKCVSCRPTTEKSPVSGEDKDDVEWFEASLHAHNGFWSLSWKMWVVTEVLLCLLFHFL